MPRLFPLIVALLGCSVLAPGAAAAQDPAADVRAAIGRLFDGMRESDSAKVGSVFHPDARMGSAVVRNGALTFRPESPAGFLRAVGAPKQVAWDERITNLRIEIDGPLASAWMDYTFHAGTRLSHCGVNAMQLVRGATGWQIISLVDTRRQEGCGG